MEPTKLALNDYILILKRRKLSIIIPAFAIFAISVVTAILMPPIYKSTSTILIEEQEIPADFVMATVTSFVEQRLQSINQRIMSTSRLLEIINRFELYPDLRKKFTTEQIVEKMRNSIQLATISAEVVDKRTGRPSSATVAFTLTYEGKGIPDKVQRVANILASLFLEENLRVRERQTRETSQFLKVELKRLKIDLDQIEAKISAYKSKHINELPEIFQVNMQSLNNTERNIDRTNQQLQSLREREGYLQTQLASITPLEKMTEDKKRLRKLRIQLANLETRFTAEYPDVIKTKEEIKKLKERIKDSGDGAGSADSLPDNPAYITLASQLASTQSEIGSVKRQIIDLTNKAEDYRRRIEATPKVEEIYKALIIERNNTQAKYDDLARKFMEARVAHGLEKEQKGERFTIIDPARLPEKPYKPNRMAIIMIGLVLGIAAGVAIAAIKEYTDSSVLSAETLSMFTSFPVLAGIPEIVTAKDIRRKKIIRSAQIAGFIILVVGGLVIFHFLVMDLNIFWAKLMRRLAL